MAPGWATFPLVILATIATVIASQALISGAFSLTRQAVQLGYSPRLAMKHTSERHIGQIYVPSVNWALMIACVALVVGFRHSENLAAAYGLAVSGTMLITTLLFFVVVRERFGWPPSRAIPLCALFLFVDLAFFGATLFKIPAGGWLPLAIGAILFTIFTTWSTGRELVRERVHAGLPLREFVASLADHPPVRAPGTGAYLFSMAHVTPPTLLASLRHHDSLHEQVLVVSILTETRPRVHALERAEIADLGHGFHEVILRFGFLEDPDVPRALTSRVGMKLGLDMDTITYFLGRESIQVTDRPGMARWREYLYALISRNAATVVHYFRLPPDQTVEFGVVVAL
jgi:KUP system potassium uptake protein